MVESALAPRRLPLCSRSSMSCFFVAANGTSAVVPSVAADGTPAGELCDECRWWSGSLLAFLFRRRLEQSKSATPMRADIGRLTTTPRTMAANSAAVLKNVVSLGDARRSTRSADARRSTRSVAVAGATAGRAAVAAAVAVAVAVVVAVAVAVAGVLSAFARGDATAVAGRAAGACSSGAGSS